MKTALFVVIALLWFAASSGLLAESSNWYEGELAKVRLISSVKGVGNTGELRVGLQFRMQAGWKIYWRTPGEAGFPPQTSWKESLNLESVEMRWPAPSRFDAFNLKMLGYEDEVIFPVYLRLEQPGHEVQLRADIRYLICKNICIPEVANVLLTIPAGPANPSIHAAAISKFDALVPGDGTLSGLSIHRVFATTEGEKTVLIVDVRALAPFVEPDLYIEAPSRISFSTPNIKLFDNRLLAVMTMDSHVADFAKIADKGLVITVVDGLRAMEKKVPIRLIKDFHAARGSTNLNLEGSKNVRSMTVIVLLALLGGFILNLMPCVLPVLSIKLLEVVKHGGGELSRIRRNFLATAVGIVASFMFIVSLLMVLKGGGVVIGWGIQFQQPVFLATMIVVLTLFACNMIGLFEIRLPQSVVGITLHGDSGSLGGSFLTGVFATLLATPCSAPLLGTAVGFALSRGSLEILLIFTSLAVGFASPYLLIAMFPATVKCVPRPGRWMVWLRYFMGLSLLATTVWLLFVIKLQIGIETSAILAALMVLISTILLARCFDSSILGRHAGKVVFALVIIAITLPIIRNAPLDETGKRMFTSESLSGWRKFNRKEIDRLVAAGKVVFVDVTASWCITCQVNKKVVIQSDKVAMWLSRDDVVAMRADWSLPDPVISQYLASYGRYGIPFNVIYGGKVPKGIVLPELLTSSAVMNAARLASPN